MKLPDRLAVQYVKKMAMKSARDSAELAGALGFYMLEAAAKVCGPATSARFQKLAPELEELLDAISLAGEERGED